MEKFCFNLLGLIVLMTWNITINIATEYYIGYRLKSGNSTSHEVVALERSFFNDIIIISQVMIFLVALSSFFHRPKNGKEIQYISVALIVLLVGFIILIIMSLLDSTNWETQFIYINYFLIAVMEASSGWMQVSLFAMAGSFQEKVNLFPSIITGMNLCGVIATLFFVLLLVVKIGPWKLVAIYYSIAGAMCVVGLFLCRFIKTMPFYSSLKIKKNDNEKVSKKIQLYNDLRRLVTAFKMCYPTLLSTYVTYLVTLTIFPTLVRTSVPQNQNIKLTDDWYGIICSFVIFNILAFVTSPIPDYWKFPSRKWIFIPTFARIAFIPIFMYANCFHDIRSMPVTIPDWFFLLCSILLSVSHGYYSSLSAAYTPEYAPGYEREAGYLTFIFTSGGLVSGTFGSKLINYIITK